MTGLEAISLIVVSLIVPFGVQLIKHEAISGRKAQWIAIGISIVAGLVCGLVGGIPTTPAAWVTCIFAAIGGVQLAYAAYKSVGITSKWLDALSDVSINE